MKAIDLIFNAIDLINKYGWIQQSFGNKTDGFCLLGALQYNIYEDTFNPLEYAKVKAIIQDLNNVDYVVHLNDRILKSKRQAISVLKAAGSYILSNNVK